MRPERETVPAAWPPLPPRPRRSSGKSLLRQSWESASRDEASRCAPRTLLPRPFLVTASPAPAPLCRLVRAPRPERFARALRGSSWTSFSSCPRRSESASFERTRALPERLGRAGRGAFSPAPAAAGAATFDLEPSRCTPSLLASELSWAVRPCAPRRVEPCEPVLERFFLDVDLPRFVFFLAREAGTRPGSMMGG